MESAKEETKVIGACDAEQFAEILVVAEEWHREGHLALIGANLDVERRGVPSILRHDEPG